MVLPIEPREDYYKLINAKEAHKRGFLHLTQWLEEAEQEWTQRRGEKAERMTVYERLDRVHGLTGQNPQASYRVLYNTSGTFLTAAVIQNEEMEFEINGQSVAAQAFVADTKTYFLETTNSHEAFFLVAVLNAPVTDKLIKPMQSRGLWGPRDIHKKVLELPIPKFEVTNRAHKELRKNNLNIFFLH